MISATNITKDHDQQSQQHPQKKEANVTMSNVQIYRLLLPHPYVCLQGVCRHVHMNQPGKTEWEGAETATRAAAAGGQKAMNRQNDQKRKE